MDWMGVKTVISEASGLSMDALHVHAGIGLQLVAALLLRRWIGSIVPWLAVLAALLLNEWSDLAHEVWHDRAMQYEAAWTDTWNTMLQPTLLLLLARALPQLFDRPPPAEPEPAAEE